MAEHIPDWMKEGLDHIWRPYTQMHTAPAPLAAVRTEGCTITLADGRTLTDGIASWWTAVHGYNHPHIKAAMHAQLDAMPHVMFGGLVNEPALRLAKRLADITPGDLTRVFFAESGSVAVEVAMKTALQYFLNQGERRPQFVHFRGGYHGDTMAAMAVCDPEEGMHEHFAGMIPQHKLADLPQNRDQAEAFAEWLYARRGDVAAVLVEPLVQGAGGMVFHSAQTLRYIREACDAAGVLLIADEIFTGFGRTGQMFACEAAGIVPDIMTLSKALTGGACPLSAAIMRAHVVTPFMDEDPMKALMHGPTYMGHALGCAAGNASLDLFEREDRLGAAARISQQLEQELAPCRALNHVVDVRVMGAIGVVQLGAEVDVEALKPLFVEAGVWVRPFRDIVYLTPALTISENELGKLTQAIHRVLTM